MNKAKEISTLWKQIKPQIGELARLCHEVESHAEVTADAYQRGYEAGLNDKKEGNATCQYCEYAYLDETEEPCKNCCKAYINKYKPKAKEGQIQVGDEVSLKGGSKGFVTRVMLVNKQKSAYVVWSDGYVGNYSFDVLQKTGKHYSDVVEVLQKMEGDSNA